jgi:hypothetical protein
MATTGRPDHHKAGPRLPTSPAPAILDCFRCSEDRRVLRLYLVGVTGKTIGSMRLCDACAAALIPLDPDPLDVSLAS